MHTTSAQFKKVASKTNRGFALVFTVLIVSLILALTMTIADISYRQSVLSNLARDSQAAFYQADAGLECGLYYDLTKVSFRKGSKQKDVPTTITCGLTVLRLDKGVSTDDYFMYAPDATVTGQCFKVLFDKTDAAVRSVESSGYNLCTDNPRQVERTLSVSY